ANPVALAALRREIGARPVWLVASTHAGEEEIAAAAHAQIAHDQPGLLTIIAPRHPVRGPAIAKMLHARGLRTARRGTGEAIAAALDAVLERFSPWLNALAPIEDMDAAPPLRAGADARP